MATKKPPPLPAHVAARQRAEQQMYADSVKGYPDALRDLDTAWSNAEKARKARKTLIALDDIRQLTTHLNKIAAIYAGE